MSRRLLPLAGVIALALVPYLGFFSPRVPAGRDLLYYFYPLKARLAESVRAGEMPWIDPYRWGGLPLLGAPGAAAFDPGNLLFLALPLAVAAKAWMLLRLAIGIGGFAAFARRLGLTAGGAAVAGLAFGLSGASVSTVPFLPTSSAFCFVPWVAAFSLDLRRAPGVRTALPLALVGGLVILASLPEVLLHAGLVALLLSFPERDARRAALPRLAGAALLALLLALGLGAAALVPGAVSAADTVRGPGGGTNLEFASAGALPVKRLPELLSDGIGSDWAEGAPDAAAPYPYLPSITPGRVALLLALSGLALGGRGRLRAGALVVVGLLLAVGRATPLFAAAVTVFPPLASLRYPEKHAILAGFGFAFLAALGLRALERALSDRARRLVLPLLALAILLDRERTARRLVETAGPEVLDRPPALLAALPPAAPGAPPPRLFHRDSYAPVPAYDVRDLAAANRYARASVSPEYATLFHRGYLFELDYDLSLPLAAFEWTRLLQHAIPAGGPLPERLLRSCGVAAEVVSRQDESRFTPRLGSFRAPLAPYRFARRAVFDPDGRRLFRRALDEAFEPDTAYVSARGAPAALVKGAVLGALDLPSALTLDVEVPAGGTGMLMVYRLLAATADATLDGRRVTPLDLSFGFTAVAVPEGRHVLRLRPDTRWVKIGATLTGCSLLVLVAASLRLAQAAAAQRPR
jgi:hypothetical protein